MGNPPERRVRRSPTNRFLAREKVPGTEQETGSEISMLEKFQTYQQVLFDLTANYLEPMNSAYQRLNYLYSLREPATGKYVHEGLAKVYGAEAVDQVLAHCHEEVFERLLEMPLNVQGEDLGLLLGDVPGAAKCGRENCRSWAPENAPSYLKELYCCNLDALLELRKDEGSRARPNS